MHDCFTINQILSTEALGFSKDGRAGYDYLDGRFTREDKVAVNLSGGLKSKGHPVGATGASMHALIYKQLDRRAHRRQGQESRDRRGLQRRRLGRDELRHGDAAAELGGLPMSATKTDHEIRYNGISFTLEKSAKGWNIEYRKGQPPERSPPASSKAPRG